MLRFRFWIAHFAGRVELNVGTGREAIGCFAVIAEKKHGCLHTPRCNRGGEPVGNLVLEGRKKEEAKDEKSFEPVRDFMCDTKRTRPRTKW